MFILNLNEFNIYLSSFYIGLILLLLIIFGSFNQPFLNNNKLVSYNILNTIGYLFILSLLYSIYYEYFNNIDLITYLFILDSITYYSTLIILIISIIIVKLSINFFYKSTIKSYEYILLFMISIIGLILVIRSNNLLSIYINIELLSLSFYVLSSYKKNSAYSIEAGFKYFILGAFSSGILLLGINYIYLATNNINFIDLSYIYNHYFFLIGMILFISGLLFKLGVIPFHTWLPDVYEGSLLPITTYYSLLPKFIILLLLVRILFNYWSFLSLEWQILILISSLLSITIASIIAINQKKIIRLLAYSSISHYGYLLLGLISYNITSIQSIVIYGIIYIITTLNIFTILLSLKTQQSNIEIKYVFELKGLHLLNPFLGFTMMISLFSLMGIPPLAGFFAKYFIFVALINSNLFYISLITIILSVISAFYYLYLIKIMYFDKILLNHEPLIKITLFNKYIIYLCTLFIICFIYFSDYIYNLSIMFLNSF
uniref:NADH dehydrogenase subunit 2 n=1 Tax=Gefionella okellyi TaxID=2853422 RepID=A0A0B5GSI2_9EUKA|nr:NADH dehydrogenase subunit 2 [Gefionella okellyi]